MSRYPEAREAQHRHSVDNSYQSNGTPNPDQGYDQQPNPDYDRTPPQGPPQPADDLYSPLLHTYPPQPPASPANVGYRDYHTVSPPPLSPTTGPHNLTTYAGFASPSPGPSMTPYQSADESQDDPDLDARETSLPRRDSSSMSAMKFGVGYDGEDGGVTPSDTSRSNIFYGRIPNRVPRRYRTIKKIELFHGNFVLDNAVPRKLLDMCANRTEREFTHMRYSAVTCDPNDFKESGFTLRQVHYDPPRRTELFILITMYNEDEEFFCRTMHGVIKNVTHLCGRERSKTWGKEGWKKVVVCIVSDGRGKINSRTLSVIATMGCYQEGVAKTKVSNKDVAAHLYEYTTQISITPSLKIEGPEKGIVPVQLIFCLKEKNQKKLNSHRWFFNAFGDVLQPNVCVLLDVGTVPGPTSIYHLWKAFDITSNVGGACGELVVLKGKHGEYLINPLVAAQNFEYKMSNILDMPLESTFGYITVLPGAFSAYRYIALQNDASGKGPLYKYFLGETTHGAGAGLFAANMYLAEDRILCWEIVSKRGGTWTLHYVKSAYAATDVPDRVPELIFQRRRWLNGSLFAAVHSMVHFYLIYRSNHGFLRKFWIHVEIIYLLFKLIFSWFALANYYIAFSILSTSMEDPSFGLHGIKIANVVLNYFYLGLLAMCFILSLGTRTRDSKWGYTAAMIGFGFITIYTTVATFVLAVKGIKHVAANGPLTPRIIFTNTIFRNIVLSLSTPLGLYIIASLIFFEPWHMITSFIQYLLMVPSYTNVLNVYAFANVHDLSWGTKGDNTVAKPLGTVDTSKNRAGEVEVEVPTDEKDINALYEDAIHVLGTKPKAEAKVDENMKREDYYRAFRTNLLIAWVLTNALLGVFITTTNAKASAESGGSSEAVKGYLAFMLFSVAGLAFVQFIGSSLYMLVRLFAGE